MQTIRATMQPPLLTCFFSALLISQLMMTAAAAAAVEAVKVSTTPIFPEIPLGQARKDFQVLLRVEAPAAAAAARSHIDVVAVVDVSGSMNDQVAAAPPPPEKRRLSRLDVLKAAVRFMVAKLHDGDRLSVVVFNDRPVKELSSGGLLYMSGDGRRNAENVVDKLEARGGTALLPALEEAVKVLDGRPGDGRSRLGFIVVITDGSEDHGSGHAWSERRWELIHGALCKYPIHAIGLGGAHDPEPLLYLSQESHGTYSFVDDDNADKLPGALAVCLAGITTVAAVDARVVLKAAAAEPAGGGVRIDRVDAGGHDAHVGCGGAACEVAIGVLYAGEAKHFVVHLHVPAAASVEDGGYYYCDGLAAGCDDRRHRRRHEKQHLLAVGYSYRPHLGSPAITAEGHGVFVQRSPEMTLGGGGRHAHALLLPSPVVLHHIVRFELLELVAGLVDGGELLADGANAGEVLQLRWEEFRACHQFWGGLNLAGLEREVDAMASGLRTAGTAAYVYAWVSSHRMQRAASLGSPARAAAEFLTPAMRALMEEAQRLPLLHAAETPAAGAGESVVRHGVGSGDCGVELEMIGRRLELWSKVRRDVQHLVSFRPSAAAVEEGEEHLAAVFHEASLEAIDRAMHRDIYLAAVFASKQRRCHAVVGK